MGVSVVLYLPTCRHVLDTPPLSTLLAGGGLSGLIPLRIRNQDGGQEFLSPSSVLTVPKFR